MANIQSATAKSIRPFKSSEEYLVAMKEDLAEWLNELYGLGTGLEQLVRDLETGSLLCQHANNVSRVAHHFCCQYPELLVKVKLPQAGVTYTAAAQPGTFLARDNVSNFIQWCRKEMQIKGSYTTLSPRSIPRDLPGSLPRPLALAPCWGLISSPEVRLPLPESEPRQRVVIF